METIKLLVNKLLDRYAICLGQMCNAAKSINFAGATISAKNLQIYSLLVFTIGSIAFIYLGAHIFLGKPKSTYFQFITDRIKV